MPPWARGRTSLHTEIVRDADGNPVVGQFTPILTVEEWEGVLAVIGDRTQAGRGKNTRTYLLTGTLYCGKQDCTGKLRALKAHASRVKDPNRFHYTCESTSNGGCGGGVSIPGNETDEWVSEASRSAAVRATIRKDWPAMPLARKRALIEEALAAVVVNPAHGRRGFTPDRLEVV